MNHKIGRFELADKSTLFLDEVGDMPLELQPKLLRVLQDQEFEKLGSIRTQRVDVRVVAATNRDLFELCRKGKFREDLYYRLNVFPIVVLPLRKRPEDIPLLVTHFAQRMASRRHKRVEYIPDDVMEDLMCYDWPGNVRELQNFVERSVILARGTVLRPPLSELGPKQMTAKPIPGSGTLREVEREHILQALRDSNWVIGGPHGGRCPIGPETHDFGLSDSEVGYLAPSCLTRRASAWFPQRGWGVASVPEIRKLGLPRWRKAQVPC